MGTVPLDIAKVQRCRSLAGEIADDVQRYVDNFAVMAKDLRS